MNEEEQMPDMPEFAEEMMNEEDSHSSGTILDEQNDTLRTLEMLIERVGTKTHEDNMTVVSLKKAINWQRKKQEK